MKNGLVYLSLIAAFALAAGDVIAQQPGIQPQQQQPQQQQQNSNNQNNQGQQQPQQQQQSQQQQNQQQNAQPQFPPNGNFPGAQMNQFDGRHILGQWASPCMQTMPAGYPMPPMAIPPSVFRRVTYTFMPGPNGIPTNGPMIDGMLNFEVSEYRDFVCSDGAFLSASHVEHGFWHVQYTESLDPTSAQVFFGFEACGGAGCAPVDVDRSLYSQPIYMLKVFANQLLFGLRGGGGAANRWLINQPLYMLGTQPGALPPPMPQQYQQSQQQYQQQPQQQQYQQQQ